MKNESTISRPARLEPSPPGYWIKKDGTVLKISKMSDAHLQNTITMLERGGVREADKIRAEQDAIMSFGMPRGEMAQDAFLWEMQQLSEQRPYAAWIVAKYQELIAERESRKP